MSTTIQIKRSSTASAIPVTGDLAVGELAVNLADKRLFAKQADGTIIELSTNPTDLDAATLRIDGVEITASATELNSLDGLTATTAELNILDGVTATATEINKLDGFTGSTAELNLLDGVTATTAELNFVDGVTSNIQTQLNSKAATTTSPTITLAGDLSGNATLTNLGNATLTATVADDSHNHVISNVDGLQTALDSKANLSGANFTGSVDVTGTITADGLEVNLGSNGNYMTVGGDDSSLGRGLTFTSYSNAGGTGAGHIINAKSSAGQIKLQTQNLNRLLLAENGDVSFYEDTGTTAKMVWDASAESLGIGTASPNAKLNIVSNTASAGDFSGSLRVKNESYTTGTYAGVLFDTADTINSYITSIRTPSFGGALSFGTNSGATANSLVERMRIDSAGNVGIGTASPNEKLQVDGNIRIGDTATGINDNEEYSITSGGQLIISANDSASDTSYTGLILNAGKSGGAAASSSAVVLQTNNTERARIDSSGNLLVGQTSPSNIIAGMYVRPSSSSGFIGNGTNAINLGRINSDGIIANFLKDGAPVGSIGADQFGDVYTGSTTTGIVFTDTIDAILPRRPNAHNTAITDTTSLGWSNQRFKDLYLSGGVYLGGTGAANKLDDYEEGNWSTALSIPSGSVSYSLIDLTYTKIGRVVYINGRLDILSVSSPSGTLGLTLPFAVSVLGKSRFANIGVSTLNFDVPSNILSQAFTAESGSVANLLQTTDNGSWFNADASILTGNEEFQISGFYLTDS